MTLGILQYQYIVVQSEGIFMIHTGVNPFLNWK